MNFRVYNVKAGGIHTTHYASKVKVRGWVKWKP